ncbi:hypothetical protein ACI65C_004843 [Semiaphis heraclei]
MKGLVNRMLVTGSAASEIAELVGTVPVAPPYPSSPSKGERCGGPTITTPAITANDTDNGQRSATLEPDLTISPIERNDNILRLRGGGNDEQDNDMELDTDDQEIVNSQKRFKSNSPEATPDKVTDTIMESLNQIDTTLAGIRTYMADMITSTKIGKKWAGGLENFLSEILAQLDKGPSPDFMMVGTPSPTANRPVMNSATQKPSAKNKLGEFHPLQRQVSKSKKRKGSTHTQKQVTSDKLKAAKNRPVKPAFIVNNNEDKIKLDDIWKVVSSKISNPKLDGCRKLPSGDFVLTTSDDKTADAIRLINDGLAIRETVPRKPRMRQEKRAYLGLGCRGLPDDIQDHHRQKDLRGHGLHLPQLVHRCSTLRRCLKTDHRTTDCKAESSTCFHCAKTGHNRINCPEKAERPCCAHCGGAHTTLYKDCAQWLCNRTLAMSVLDIALIQEPYSRRGKLINLEYNATRTAKSKLNEQHGIWAAVVIFNTSFDLISKPQLSTMHTVVISVSLPGQTPIDVMSSYFQFRRETELFIDEISLINTQLANRLIFGVDANAFSPRWDDPRRNEKGRLVEQLISEKGLTIENTPGNG